MLGSQIVVELPERIVRTAHWQSQWHTKPRQRQPRTSKTQGRATQRTCYPTSIDDLRYADLAEERLSVAEDIKFEQLATLDVRVP